MEEKGRVGEGMKMKGGQEILSFCHLVHDLGHKSAWSKGKREWSAALLVFTL